MALSAASCFLACAKKRFMCRRHASSTTFPSFALTDEAPSLRSGMKHSPLRAEYEASRSASKVMLYLHLRKMGLVIYIHPHVFAKRVWVYTSVFAKRRCLPRRKEAFRTPFGRLAEPISDQPSGTTKYHFKT